MNTQEYLLNCLAEEAAEVIQAISKIQRFGLDSDYADGVSNLEALRKEVADFNSTIDALVDNGFPDILQYPMQWENQKRTKIDRYMQVSRDMGLLKD